MPIKFTLIVPTKDRPDTLLYTLKTILDQKRDDIEIIVSDNFSGPKVKEVVDSIQDQRLRYIRTGFPMGMSEHWDFALEHVKGEWVAFIGDDDGLIPYAIDKLNNVIENNPNIRAITCVNSWYRWPNESHNFGKLSINGSKGYEIRNCRDIMRKALLGLPVSQPTIYTGGFVRLDLINEIKAKSANGKFFQSITPDYYSGMAICSVEEKYIYILEALCIAGTSKHSTGLHHKKGTAEDRKKMSFYKDNKIKFYPTLGDVVYASVGSMQIYLYEAFLQAAPLRNYDLGINLEQQLIISISQSSKKIRKDLVEYVKTVADANNLDFNKILRSANLRRPIYKVRKRTLKILRSIGCGKIPTKMYKSESLKTVYDAALKIEGVLKA